MDFEQRLERAIQRGQRERMRREDAKAAEKMSAEERKTLYSQARLELSERIEQCCRRLADRFPGFQYESILNDEGWGARITRDDLDLNRPHGATNLYSRLQLVISPLGEAPIIELVGKATIRNKEFFHRRHFQQLDQLDLESFAEMIDLWVLEYAERYAGTE